MLQLKNITIIHKKDLREIVRDFSFVLNPGDKAVMIGEEGNGKSTLLKLIYQEDLIQPYAEYTGEIIRRNQRLGYLAQELSEQQKQKQVMDYFYEIPEFLDKTPRELGDLAHMLGLTPYFFYEARKVVSLSGGEKVKLQLAGILLADPEILLLDEPSNDLDMETLEWLEQFMQECPIPLLYVSHDETLIEKTANVVIHLEQIRHKTQARHTVARMGYQQYIRERLGNFERQQRLAQKERSEYQKQMERFRRVQQKAEHQQNTISRQDPHGGQKAKLLFLKMSMEQNDVLILDEPARNFSPLSNPVIRELLKNFGGAIISISHDRKYIHEVCSKTYRLTEDGLVLI